MTVVQVRMGVRDRLVAVQVKVRHGGRLLGSVVVLMVLVVDVGMGVIRRLVHVQVFVMIGG